MRQTLRIKRVYFEQIKAETKNREYRSDTPFYRARFLNREIKEIVLFYSQTENTRMLKKVYTIKLILTPAWLREIEPKIFNQQKVFEIVFKKGHSIYEKRHL